jgi:hypothetical protein
MYQPPTNDPQSQRPTEPSQFPYQQPPPQYPQQPYYPPGPPPKKRRTGLWIALGIIAVLLFACIGVSAIVLHGASTAVNSVATSIATFTPAAGSTPVPAPASNTIGKPVVVNADWTVTLQKVSTSTGSDVDKPKAGNILLVVNVTMHNTSGSTQNASTAIQWSLKDSTGQTYTQDIFFGNGPDGTVAAGGLIRGSIAYEVPKSVHSFILQFVAGIGSNDLAEWNVNN